MIPNLVYYQNVEHMVLPEGIHESSFREVEDVLTFSERRELLFNGLIQGSMALCGAGCSILYLDGSFVTLKVEPGDYDAVWDTQGVNFNILDSVFKENKPPRLSQKNKFLGEYLPTEYIEDGRSTYMIEFFQDIRHSVVKKGILKINLQKDTFLRSKMS